MKATGTAQNLYDLVDQAKQMQGMNVYELVQNMKKQEHEELMLRNRVIKLERDKNFSQKKSKILE